MGSNRDQEQYLLGVYNKDSDSERNYKYCIDCIHLCIDKRNEYCTGCRNCYAETDVKHEELPLLYEDVPESVSSCSECAQSFDVDEEDSQDAKRDAGKLKLTLVPSKIIKAIAEIREYGCKKYKAQDNWKRVSKERYRDAAYRHFLSYIENPEGLDKESGLPTLWHLACNIAFLCELEEYEKENDWGK